MLDVERDRCNGATDGRVLKKGAEPLVKEGALQYLQELSSGFSALVPSPPKGRKQKPVKTGPCPKAQAKRLLEYIIAARVEDALTGANAFPRWPTAYPAPAFATEVLKKFAEAIAEAHGEPMAPFNRVSAAFTSLTCGRHAYGFVGPRGKKVKARVYPLGAEIEAEIAARVSAAIEGGYTTKELASA
jgi:hypothetical protein